MATESEIEALQLRTGSVILEDWYTDLIEVLKKINTEAKRVKAGMYEYPGLIWCNIHWLPAGLLTEEVSGSGAVEYKSYMVVLDTGLTANSKVYVYKAICPTLTSWDKERRILFKLWIHHDSDQYIHLVSGHIADPTTLENTEYHIGFKVDGNILYATVGDGSSESVMNIGTITAGGFYKLEAVFKPGVECRFYVDGVDKGAITTSLPSGSGPIAMDAFAASIFNLGAASRSISICEVRFMQAG